MMEPSANALANVPQLDVRANQLTRASRKKVNVKYRSVQTDVLNKNIALCTVLLLIEIDQTK